MTRWLFFNLNTYRPLPDTYFPKPVQYRHEYQLLVARHMLTVQTREPQQLLIIAPVRNNVRRYQAMTIQQLKNRAQQEWSDSADIKCRYHTFEYYWAERYARIYRLPTRIWTRRKLVH